MKMSVKLILLLQFSFFMGSKGCVVLRAARLPPMWPGFKSQRRRHMWVEFVVLREVFLQVLRFSLLLKNQHFHIPILPGIR